MHYCKGNSDEDSCHDSSACGEKGWTWHSSTGCCHESPMGATDLPPCHNPGSLSHDLEGSCQSEPQGCQPMEPCPPWRCCPPQQSCNFGKPRRRVESRAAIIPSSEKVSSLGMEKLNGKSLNKDGETACHGSTFSHGFSGWISRLFENRDRTVLGKKYTL
ncbi:uncharacterized protein ACIBXB_019164 [Morphnus guianensis]